jgi:hypothetical protein
MHACDGITSGIVAVATRVFSGVTVLRTLPSFIKIDLLMLEKLLRIVMVRSLNFIM